MFGKPNYENQSGTTVNRFKIKSGKPGEQVHTIFRIAPPMHKCAEKGVWIVWEPIHWGYYGIDSKDPTKKVFRPFKCIKDKNTRCAECDLIEEYRQARKELDPNEGKDKDKRTSSDEVLTLLAPLEEFLDGRGPKHEGAHRLDKKWKMNVYMRDEQKAGTLPISSELLGLIKARKGFENKAPGLIDDYLKDGIDLIDASGGVWFDVIRTGTGFGTKDRINVLKEKKGRSEEIIMAPIVEGNEIYNALMRDCKQDLSVCSCAVLTSDQIDSLVKLQRSGDLDPEKIDKIFNVSTKTVDRSSFREEESDDIPPNELFNEPRSESKPEEPKKAEPIKEVKEPVKEVVVQKKEEPATPTVTTNTGMSMADKIKAMRERAKAK